MNEKNNSICCICGKGYYLCLACKDKMILKPWTVLTDTSEHFKIFDIVRSYGHGIYTKQEAKAKLKNVDMSDFDTYKDNIKEKINEIMNTEVTPKATSKAKKSKKVEIAKEEISEDSGVVEDENTEK